MKKFFVTLLMLLYLIPAIGVNVSMHYCGGKLASVSHKFSEKKKCFCGTKKMKKGCCKDEQQTLKIDNNQQKVEVLSQKISIPSFSILTVPSVFSVPTIFQSIDRVGYTVFHPPNVYQRPIYLLNNVFRI